ncbi:MAG: hypothetical protein NPIRA04_16140 [Nitrospirales bacterium]|nr:MAG: hypothetical protein NPIRA04_16140 [Nitrospirales bacterium]
MIKATLSLSITRQCQLLGVPRSSAYARSQPVLAEALALMRLLDELYLQRPFYGSRRLCVELQQRGYRVNRKRVRRLMRQMGCGLSIRSLGSVKRGRVIRSILAA